MFPIVLLLGKQSNTLLYIPPHPLLLGPTFDAPPIQQNLFTISTTANTSPDGPCTGAQIIVSG